MMTLEETTKIYASVLRQLLPAGGYDTAQNTVIAADVYAHAKALAQADLDAKRLLNVLESIPPELLAEYENEYGDKMFHKNQTTPIGGVERITVYRDNSGRFVKQTTIYTSR